MSHSNDNRRYSIGIIGAGYAGLTLANYLQGGGPTTHCHCLIFEAKEEPIAIVGTIRLPHAQQVLQDLNLLNDKDVRSTFPPNNTSADLVDRQAFQILLRKNISVEYSCRIVRIERSFSQNKDRYWLMDNKGREHGPFDCVVISIGLCLGKTILSPSFAPGDDSALAVVGDARWQYDTWFWDFGRQRIQLGGDIALCDAMELVQSLLPSIRAWSKDKAARSDCCHPLVLQIPTKFQLRPATFHHRWHASKLVFLCVVIAILSRLMLDLEKI